MVHVSFFKPQNTHQDGIAKIRPQINRLVETVLLLPHPVFPTEAPWRLLLGCRACICRPLLMLLLLFTVYRTRLTDPVTDINFLMFKATRRPTLKNPTSRN
jgi:hypothetical protein